MTTLTAARPTTAPRTQPTTNPLLQLHAHLFPERYADVPATGWTTATIGQLHELVAQLLAGEHDEQTAAALRAAAAALADPDDLGPAETLDAFAAELEAACGTLAIAGFIAS